jgi:hypothetical protein
MIDSFHSFLFYISSNVIYSSILRSSKYSHFYRVFHKIVLSIYLILHSCYIRGPSHISIFCFFKDKSNSTFWGVHFMKFLIVLYHLPKNRVMLRTVPNSSRKVMIYCTFTSYLLYRNYTSNAWLQNREQ